MTTVTPPAPSANGTAPAPSSSLKGIAPPSDLRPFVEKLNEVRAWAKLELIERDTLIDLLLLSALSRRHGWMVGSGGIAKSQAVRAVLACLPGPHFITQLSKDTDAQAIFGNVSPRAIIDRDVFEHKLAGLAVCRFSLIDEFNDGSDMIRRRMLMAFNERQFPNGDTLVDLPLMAAWAATNFWDNSPELAALMDRFAWRYVVDPVRSIDGRLRIIDAQLTRRAGATEWTAPPPTLDLDELLQLQAAAAQVEIPMDVRKRAVQLQDDAINEGVVFEARRMGEGLALAQAKAVMAGRRKAAIEDLIVFEHVIPNDEEEIATVAQLCEGLAGATGREAKALRKTFDPHVKEAREIKEAIANNGGKPDRDTVSKIIETIGNVKVVADNVAAKVTEAQRDQRDAGELLALQNDVNELLTQLRNQAAGVL